MSLQVGSTSTITRQSSLQTTAEPQAPAGPSPANKGNEANPPAAYDARSTGPRSHADLPGTPTAANALLRGAGLSKHQTPTLPKTLATPIAAPYTVPDGNHPAALRAYSEWSVNEAVQSFKIADEWARLFQNGKKAEDDPRSYEVYKARASAAVADRARAEQAITAELRAMFQADPKNLAGVEAAARELATRLSQGAGDDAAGIRAMVDRALQTVLTETPGARDTNTRLYNIHRAEDKLNAALADRDAGKAVSEEQLVRLRDAVAQARQAFQIALGKEIDSEISKVHPIKALKEDARIVAANTVARRHADDSEMRVAAQAEIILRLAEDAVGPEKQMTALGQLMPARLDPTARAYILSDERGARMVDNYIKWSANEVKGAYERAARTYANWDRSMDYQRVLVHNTPPALAASETLRGLTDTTSRPWIKPDMTARIFNQLRTDGTGNTPSTMDRIVRDLAGDGEWSTVLMRKEDPSGSGIQVNHEAYGRVITNLSFSMDNMGRAQDVESGQYASPQIAEEIAFVGRKLAEKSGVTRAPQEPHLVPPPVPASQFDIAFKAAAAHGTVILGLETARQLALPGAQFKEIPSNDWSPVEQANVTLKYISDGVKDYKRDTEVFADSMRKHLAPIASPLSRFGTDMTVEQHNAGVQAILNDTKRGPEIRAQIAKDRAELDLRGYRLVRFGETVGFYEKSLGRLEKFGAVQNARTGLFDSDATSNMVLLSNAAHLYAGSKIVMKLINPHYSNGLLAPQTYGWVAQTADFAEYLAETYLLQREARAGDIIAGNEYATSGDPDKRVARWLMPTDITGPETFYELDTEKGTKLKIEPYAATRMGRLPISGTLLWGIGGAAQLYMWSYIHNEVGFDPSEKWRGVLLEGLVGGFAAFHLAEAAVAFSRIGPTAYQAMKSYGWFDRWRNQEKPPLIYRAFDDDLAKGNEWSRFAVSGTKGLTAALAGLMGIAVLWDASGVGYRTYDGFFGERDPAQGLWGSPWHKVGTHAVNLFSDTVLFRLQVREFAKRYFPQAVAQHGVESLFAQRVERAATSGLVTRVATLPLSVNAIGLTVNALYMGTTGYNYLVDQGKYIADLENFDNAFLKGAGVHEMQAELMKKHVFFTGDGKGDGFALGYHAVGGAPEKFVDYLNSFTDRDQLEAAIQAAGDLPEHVQDPRQQPQLPLRVEYYTSLPANMTRDAAEANPRFKYNERTQRYEDTYTQMYFERGKWIHFGNDKQLISYDPAPHQVTKADASRVWQEEIAIAGLKQHDPRAVYFLLPDGNPASVDPAKFPTISYNENTRRFEDRATRLYYDPLVKAWRTFDEPPGRFGTYYEPRTQIQTEQSVKGSNPKLARPEEQYQMRYAPTGIEGWKNYLKARDLLPPGVSW